MANAIVMAEVLQDEPRNVTLHACEHAHVLKMPLAVNQYKLLTFRPRRIHSFSLCAMLRYSVLLRKVQGCDCLREWAYGFGR